MSILSCDSLTYHYPEAAAAALTDITVNIDEGEFVLLLGASGSGKSTFLRALNGLVPRFYGGRIGGKVHYRLTELAQLTQREIVKNLGFLHQDPERQIVLDTVEREVAFGMENIGLPMAQMKSRLAEVSQLFGLGPLLHKRTAEVSGGEKQRIALAGLLALYPHVLLLDEPTSQLDPVHAEEVLQSLRRLHEEWGFTIVMSEHRLDRTFHLADRILFFDQGRLVFDGTPLAFAQAAAKSEPEWQAFLSPITRHMLEKTNGSALPITVKEARSILRRVSGDGCLASSDDVNLLRADRRRQAGSLPLIQIEKAKAGYEGNDNVLRGLTYSISAGDYITLLGENGVGKSTLAKVIAGVVPLHEGRLLWQGTEITTAKREQLLGKIGYLSQNPNDYFLHDSVEGELSFALHQARTERETQDEQLVRILETVGLLPYRHRHPHDLSGGERQRLALAIVLAGEPQFLILDEPTRGLDLYHKDKLIQLLHTLPIKSIMVISHDIEFASAFANRISILYQGNIVADGTPAEVFSQSFSYMPQVYKLYRV